MLKTKEGKEIVPLRQYDKESEKKDEAQSVALLKKEGLREPTPNEWMDLSEETIEALRPYWPCRLRTPGGLRDRVYGALVGPRDVYTQVQPSLRLGVIGVRDKPHKHKFEKQKAKCDCGEVRG